MNFRISPSLRIALAACALAITPALRAAPVFEGKTQRPLRYHPEGTDFVIENGAEFFNRPLYGTNTPFRVDGGDKPEFSFYLPGRGGNLRLGLTVGGKTKWLSDADKIVTRYRPGSMVYEIRDPLIGKGTLHLTALALASAEGIVLRVELAGAAGPVTLVSAFGGVNGEKGRRNGDIGTERSPVTEFFQLKPEYCKDNAIEISGSGFVLKAKPGNIGGVFPQGSKLAVADAGKWNDAAALLASKGTAALPVVVAETSLTSGKPAHLSLQRIAGEARVAEDVAAVFVAAEKRREEISGKLAVDTPDPFVNAAAAAMCVASDGVWDERDGAFMHGAVAWRNKLLGWRGPYSGDALGWPDRVRRHLTYWAGQQNTSPIPATLPAPEPEGNLARNENALHSNGDMSGKHYDMNIVYIDALFRHLLWTGDLEFAREVWPVIERHLAWEKRLFRRPYGAENLPLYEAYACIWASDDLWYNGGGATHATAYNYFHNKMAARLATALGKDAKPYEQEAELISQAIRRELWMPREGWFAEGKDWLGDRSLKPNPANWTLYHTVDSQVPDAIEAFQMTRYVDTQIAHIPLHGPGVPDGGYFTLPTTNWLPYTWSTNNVVFAEATHTALAFWQAGRGDKAFQLFKGALLDSMFMGLCPGNAGMATTFDMARGEAQRDFADGVGASSRALVEGLFGVRPDALAGDLVVRPGFPEKWTKVDFKHPSLAYTFRRDRMEETWTLDPKFPKPTKLRLQVPAFRDQVAAVLVNGKPAEWKMLAGSVGRPVIEIVAAAAERQEVAIDWRGDELPDTRDLGVVAAGSEVGTGFGSARLMEISDPQKSLDGLASDAGSFRAKAVGEAGHRTVFAKLGQGDLTWWQPVTFETRPELEVIPSDAQDENSLRLRVRNNTRQAVSGKVSGLEFSAPAGSLSEEIALAGGSFVPGSNRVVVMAGGKSIEGTVVNWKLKPAAAGAPEPVDLGGAFNDSVTQIFRNEYLSPRSPFCSLAMPKQGIGSWCHPTDHFEVDDSGLRAAAEKNSGRIVLPQGIPFATPGAGDARNIAFTSRWDNYPQQVTVPLTGKARHVYLMMAGSTHSMVSGVDNGEVVVSYTDGSQERLALRNPTNWWPIDQDYLIDDFAFKRPEPVPPRVDLKTGKVRFPERAKPSSGSNLTIPGGAATVLDLPLRPEKDLKSLTVRAIANEVVIGLMSATLVRSSAP